MFIMIMMIKKINMMILMFKKMIMMMKMMSMMILHEEYYDQGDEYDDPL